MCCRKRQSQTGVGSHQFQATHAELTLGEQVPQGVALLFPNGLRAHFGSGSEKLLMELLTHSLEGSHV